MARQAALRIHTDRRATQEPGRISTEIVVTGAALALDPAEMAALIGFAIKPSVG